MNRDSKEAIIVQNVNGALLFESFQVHIPVQNSPSAPPPPFEFPPPLPSELLLPLPIESPPPYPFHPLQVEMRRPLHPTRAAPTFFARLIAVLSGFLLFMKVLCQFIFKEKNTIGLAIVFGLLLFDSHGLMMKSRYDQTKCEMEPDGYFSRKPECNLSISFKQVISKSILLFGCFDFSYLNFCKRTKFEFIFKLDF